ncbi:MAG: hypothetical protein H5T69_03025 [Chloroflexi bacterium]|nr:hypothetical protein [Chloroflexota bacterium]
MSIRSGFVIRSATLGAALSFVFLVIVPLCGEPVVAEGLWLPAQNLAPSAGDAVDVALARDAEGRVHVVWSEGGLLYHRVRVGGAWSARTEIGMGDRPSLAADSAGRVHLAHIARGHEVDQVYYRTWAAGAGWGSALNISESTNPTLDPAIAVSSSGKLAIVWTELSGDALLLYAGRSETGAVWSAAPVPQAYGTNAAVVFNGPDRPVVAWQDVFDEGFPLEVLVSEWTGAAWTLPVDVSFSPLAESLQPMFISAPAGLALAWIEDGQVAIVQRDGEGWGDPRVVHSSGVISLTAGGDGGDKAHLLWAQGDGTIWEQSWDLGAGSLGPAGRVASGQVQIGQVSVAADTRSAYAAWIAAGPEGQDVFFSMTMDQSHELALPLIRRR